MKTIKRTLTVTTLVRNSLETGETERIEKVENFSLRDAIKNGWTVESAILMECEMSVDDFYEYSEKRRV